MKKFTLIILMAIISCSVKGQENKSWPHKGAKWHYCVSNYGEDIGSEIWEVIGDTIINNKIYSIISETDGDNDKFIIITRYEDDTIYRYVNGKDYMFFTFNLNEGDVFTTFRTAGCMGSWNDSAYSSQLPLKVIEKSTINYNDNEYDRYLLYDTLFPYLYEIEQIVIYELVNPIGVINAYPFINNQESIDGNIVSDYSQVEVFLYEDGENNIVLSECNPTFLKEEIASVFFEISPNPSDGYLNITIDDMRLYGSKIVLYSMDGTKLLETVLIQDHTKINISDSAAGLYFMVITSPSGKKELKKIIKN